MFKPASVAATSERVVAPVYYAHVDNDHLREVISNLVENAVKYTPSGDVLIDVGGDDTHVRISVQDSGIGIPTEDIPHLFQKFYRVDNTDTREIGGTGLGLYLCRRLAELMGGQILVESEYRKGSTFTLELPRIDHLEAQRLMEAATTAEELSRERVAVIAETPLPPTPEPPAYAPTQPLPPQLPPQPQPAPPEPVVAPTVQPEPTPAAPQAVPQQTFAPAIQPVTPQAPNVPLSQIDQNPSAYVPSRPQMQIPVRGPEDTNQS